MSSKLANCGSPKHSNNILLISTGSTLDLIIIYSVSIRYVGICFIFSCRELGVRYTPLVLSIMPLTSLPDTTELKSITYDKISIQFCEDANFRSDSIKFYFRPIGENINDAVEGYEYKLTQILYGRVGELNGVPYLVDLCKDMKFVVKWNLHNDKLRIVMESDLYELMGDL